MIETYSLKESNDIFQDILAPFSVRNNSRYFCKLIGIPDNKTEYLNSIFLLDNSLKKQDRVYFKFINTIPLTNTTEIFTKIKEAFKFKDLTQKDFVSRKCFSYCSIDNIQNNVKKEMEISFVNICNHWYKYTQKKKSVTFDMLLNFGVKMACWVNTVIPNIANGLTHEQDSIAKILYYGDIKEHEYFFLMLMFSFGCDILYINTKEIKYDYFQEFGQNVYRETFCELPEFPKEEKVVSYETNALKAQNEVTDMYYDTTTLKPWQLQKNKVKIVPLKTTYDELFNLWEIDSNMRPRF